MEIVVKRYEEQTLRTFGKMYIDGIEIADTLEDTDRHLEDYLPDIKKLKSAKIYSKTAIPRGTYNVINYYWAKHKAMYPHIQKVPGFEGILIHGGVTEDHTEGCILVGTRKGNQLLNSAAKMKIIREKMAAAKEIKITIL